MQIGEKHLRGNEAAAGYSGPIGWVVCDALAAAVAVCPEGVVARRLHEVAVAWQDALTRGMSVLSKGGGVEVVETYDMTRFMRLMELITC